MRLDSILKIYNNPEDFILDAIVNRKDCFAVQNPDGSYSKSTMPITRDLVKKHLAGSITLGVYQFDIIGQVKWICFDIDSHPKKQNESYEDIQARNAFANWNMQKMCRFLEDQKIPHILEASGSLHSYHIWILTSPTVGRVARAFGMDLAKGAQVECEIFPKQDSVNYGGYGNLIKLPFAIHQKTKARSKIKIGNGFIETFNRLPVHVLNISAYKSPEKQTDVTKQTTVTKGTVRDCIKNALGMQLTGTGGHFMRIAVCREYYNAGMREPEQLVDLFRMQNDFSPETSLGQVQSIIKRDMPNVKCSKIAINAGTFVNCNDCQKNT